MFECHGTDKLTMIQHIVDLDTWILVFFCEALLGVKIPRSAPSCRPQDVLLIFLPDWQGRAGYDYLLLRFGPGTGEEVNVGLVTQPHWNLIEFAIFLA